MSLCFPKQILDQHVVILGKTRSGKSSALRHIAEHLLKQGKRVCIIDPKGDWWGIKSSADGREPGYPVIAFGDFKEPKASDVPIKPEAAGQVVELITTGNRPCVIGMRGWMPGQLTKFWLTFAPALFNADLGEFYLLVDECHNFCPKGKIQDPDAGKCLHWFNRLASEGLGLGLHLLIASQRPQKVHNDTLTCCETLVAMKVIHAADRNAVKDWIDGCGDKDQGREVLDSLAELARGEAWVWSPEAMFGPTRLQFPMFETFDSFAEPKQRAVKHPSTWADVNLDEVKNKLATVIEEAKANDPAELRRQIVALKKELKARDRGSVTRSEPPKVKTVEVPALNKTERARLTKLVAAVEKFKVQEGEAFTTFNNLLRIGGAIHNDVLWLKGILEGKFSAFIPDTLQGNKIATGQGTSARPLSARPAPLPRPSPPSRDTSDNGDLPRGERQCLIAAAQHADGVTREQLTVLVGYKRSARDTYLQRLRARGYVTEDRGLLVATETGIAALGTDYELLPTGQALIDHWRAKLTGGELVIFEAVVAEYPAAVQRESLEQTTGYKRSARDTYIQRLKSRRVIELVGRGEIRAAEQLFTE